MGTLNEFSTLVNYDYKFILTITYSTTLGKVVNYEPRAF